MIALVDCNNFFASCERLFRPDLADKPVLVLSNNDGCVVARSEEVKAAGVPMGVPYFKIRDIVAKNKITCFSSNFPLYSNMSQRVLEVLGASCPRIEVYSIDEAFLDISKLAIQDFNNWGDNLSVKISKEVGLPVSVGVAPTKTLAKLATSYAKKNKRTCLIDPKQDRGHYESVLAATEIESIWGIGRSLAPKMRLAGVTNALQLTRVSKAWVKSIMGLNGEKIWKELRADAVHGFEEIKPPRKSLMVSRSFGQKVDQLYELETAAASFASSAAYQLRKHQQIAGVVGVFVYFKDISRQKDYMTKFTSFDTSTNDTSEIVGKVLSLTRDVYDNESSYQKIGVFMHHLSSENICQTHLFEDKNPDKRRRSKLLMKSVDDINRRFGKDTVFVASINRHAAGWQARKKRISPAYTTEWSQLPRVSSM